MLGSGHQVLSVQNRMRSGSDFTAAVRRGRRAGRRAVVVHCLDRGTTRAEFGPASSAPPGGLAPLVGFVVSKSVGNAVVRNRVQRRLRHLMRDRVTALPPGCLLVVRAQPAAALTADLGAELDSVLGAVLRPGTSRESARGDLGSRS